MSSLADVLPSRAYSLSYVLPILFVSLILVFAGSFLTLQRSQSFAPRNDAMQLPGAFGELDKKKPIFYLEGGIGGICAGYAFGLHASTFFALLVSHKTSSHSLSANAFVAVWMLSCIPLAILGGRFKYAALLFAGITGGALTALALCIAIHPSLLTRQIILGIFAVLLSLFVAIPLPFSQEPATRLAMCATGAFGIAYSAAILGSVSAWSDVWARLWISNDITWGTSAERGLSAAFWLLFTLGWVSDWSLKRYFGGNPDQKWDAYLAEYTTSLPQCDERAGTFVPDTSTIWDRVSHPFARRSRVSSTHVYDATILGPSPPFTEKPLCEYDKPRLLQKSSDRPIARLRALARESSGRKREAVKFKPLSSAQEHDLSSDDEGIALPLVPPLLRRQDTNRTQTSVSNTLTNGSDIEFDYEKERARLFGVKKEVLPSDSEGDAAPEYSDYEEDVTTSVSKKRDVPAGAPLFISHGQDSIADYSAHTPITSESIPPGAVPLTPSLINAIDRIAVAQSEAFGARQRDDLPLSTTGDSVLLTPTVNGPSNGEHWDAFWRDVTTKASQGARR